MNYGISDSDLETTETTGTKYPGRLRRWWTYLVTGALGWIGWRVALAYQVRVRILEERLEMQKMEALVNERKLKAEIDSLEFEKTALAKLYHSVVGAVDLHTLLVEANRSKLKRGE